MNKLYWEDFDVGQVSVYGDRYVGADEIKEFAAGFDPQPTLVGGLCASGWHTCAIMMRIIADGFVLNSSSMGAPGVEEVRWLAPVRPGDTLRVRTTVLDKRASRSRPQLGFVDLYFEVLNDAGACVMTSRTNMMFARRQPVAEASA
jgi:acyl dehydratase